MLEVLMAKMFELLGELLNVIIPAFYKKEHSLRIDLK